MSRAHGPVGALMGALLILGGCSADFGGRCATPDDCSEGRICELGYCLDPIPDGGPDGGDAPDGQATPGDGGPGDDPDGGAPSLSCDVTPIDQIPAYDDAHRPCPDQHTVALWRFDDDLLPVGPGGLDGPGLASDPNGDRVGLEQGASSRGVDFRGNGDPRVIFDGPVRAEKPLTVEAWVRTEGHDDQYHVVVGNLRRAVAANPERMGGWELIIDDINDQGEHQVGVAVSTAETDNRVEEYWADERITPSKWAHVAIVLQEDRTRVVVNGSVTELEGLPTTPRPQRLTFGRRADLLERFYSGQLDELRISSIARPIEELQRVAREFNRPN